MFVKDDPSQPNFNPLPLAGEISRKRVLEREALLGRLDKFRRRLNHVEAVSRAIGFQERALTLISSPAAVRAFELDREPPALRNVALWIGMFTGPTVSRSGCAISHGQLGPRLPSKNVGPLGYACR